MTVHGAGHPVGPLDPTLDPQTPRRLPSGRRRASRPARRRDGRSVSGVSGGTLLVYVDDVYRVAPSGHVTTDRAFLLFACEVGRHFDRLLLLGRTVRDGTPADYALPPHAELRPLPHYPSLADLGAVARASLGTCRGFWRAAGEADVVWAFGPHPLQLALVLCAVTRRRRVVLGVRQDTVEYFRARAGRRRTLAVALARALDDAHAVLARRLPATVVGEALAARMAAREAFPFTATLVRKTALADAARAPVDGGPVRLLTVGRLEPEKDPLLLVEALRQLEARTPGRFSLTWVGRGTMAGAVGEAIRSSGLVERVELRGYVPFGSELLALYREADIFVHVALTEGVPQVLVEAHASGLPVVATAVGGIPAATGYGHAALLVPPRDAVRLAGAIERVASDQALALSIASAGLELARERTMEAEAARVAGILRGAPS